MDRSTAIRDKLQQRFAPLELSVLDDSAKHAGHAGARDGRGHFTVRVVSKEFADHNRIERHRMVYAALGELMQTDIHALSITAFTPEEIN
ncbi:MAG TPA: BolA family protein [Gammaproteobacteria bacterium]